MPMAMRYQYAMQGTFLGSGQIAPAEDPFIDLSPSNQLTITAPIELGWQPNAPTSLLDATNPGADSGGNLIGADDDDADSTSSATDANASLGTIAQLADFLVNGYWTQYQATIAHH